MVVAGGSLLDPKPHAIPQSECLELKRNKWRALPNMVEERTRAGMCEFKNEYYFIFGGINAKLRDLCSV